MLLPGALMAGVLLFFLATKTSEAWAALKSVRAVLVIGALAAGWIVLSFVLKRFVRWPWVRAVVLGGAGVVLSVLLILPYYQDTKVVETAQAALGGAIARPSATTLPPQPDEPPPPPSSAPAGPVQITTGAFQGIDHSARGTANLIRLPDGRLSVELFDIDIQNGPDYDLYLVEGEDRQGKDGGIKLDDLRGNVGTQYYDVPAEVEAGPGWTVLVWCEAFGVPVANATQTTV